MHKVSEEVLILVSIIFFNFSALVYAIRFCQGSIPLRKYSKTYPTLSTSSLLLCSRPTWVLIEAYLAVPVKFLPVLGAMWIPSLDIYLLERPKSIIYNLLHLFPLPIKKLSGLMSLWIKCFPCINSSLYTIWSPSIQTVFKEN